LWLIETDVFQMPQLHKHFYVVQNPRLINMRSILLALGLGIVVLAKSQSSVWQQNKSFVDSLISMYRTKSGCSLTGSTLKQAKKKRRLDLKLIEFLNDFYKGEFNSEQMEVTLQKKFKLNPWRFDEKGVPDSFHVFKGRLRSFGNLEPFITYAVLNNEIVGTHITIRIRSTVDCLQTHDGEIPDLQYLSSLIPGRINFPFKVEGWTEYFDSKIWIRKGLPTELQDRICRIIGNSSATPLK
jgi:hypothetical protein